MQLMVILSLLVTVAMVTCTSTTQEPQVTAQACVTGWSDWLNRDKPDTDGGDYEQLTSAEVAAFCPGGFVHRVECETSGGTAFNSSGEVIACTVQEGLRCNNADNAPVGCSDFRIRYRCRCPGSSTTSAPLAPTASGPADPVTTEAPAAQPSTPAEVTAVQVSSDVNGSTFQTFPPDTTSGETTPSTESTTPTPTEAITPAVTTPVVDVVTTEAPAAVTTPQDAGTTSTEAPTSPAPTSSSTAEVVPSTTARPGPESLYPSLDEIVAAFRRLTQTEYFQRLPYQDQILLLELTSGGQVGEIQEILDSQGWERVLSFMYGMPFNYFDTLMRFVLASLEKERLMHATV